MSEPQPQLPPPKPFHVILIPTYKKTEMVEGEPKDFDLSGFGLAEKIIQRIDHQFSFALFEFGDKFRALQSQPGHAMMDAEEKSIAHLLELYAKSLFPGGTTVPSKNLETEMPKIREKMIGFLLAPIPIIVDLSEAMIPEIIKYLQGKIPGAKVLIYMGVNEFHHFRFPEEQSVLDISYLEHENDVGPDFVSLFGMETA